MVDIEVYLDPLYTDENSADFFNISLQQNSIKALPVTENLIFDVPNFLPIDYQIVNKCQSTVEVTFGRT